jgi:hypothetical protein
LFVFSHSREWLGRWIGICAGDVPFIVRADEKLTAFVALEAAIRACGELV